MSRPERIVITGASRGLGLEFTRLWLGAGREIFALARRPGQSKGLASLSRDFPGRLHVAECNVAEDGPVAAAAAEVAGRWDAIDLLLNNAGTYGPKAETIENVRLEEIRRVFETNTLGPIRLTRALLPLLRRGIRPRVVMMTSLMGSIGDNGSGGSWAYRISKAALNMAGKNLSVELGEAGIAAMVIHPGWVRTDMGGAQAPLGIEESVAAMAGTIDALTMERSGSFLDRNGAPLPW